ncbi:hypothetical protein [Candidatus Hodarchaeum mangrovi]
MSGLSPYIPFTIEQTLGNFSSYIISSLEFILPILIILAFATSNIALILGGITYLVDYNEENGKRIIARSLIVLILIMNIFTYQMNNKQSENEYLSDIVPITSYITSYLLFTFAALSLIVFIGNLGLFLIEADLKRKKSLKKSIICLLCVLLPIGFKFPKMPIWLW